MKTRLFSLWRALTWSWTPASEREAGEAVVRNFWIHWFPTKMADESFSWSYSFWLGTVSLALFFILTVTGFLLMFFYVPSVERAYWSIKDLDFSVSFGWLLRNQHRWAAHLMVATVFLHMARVFFSCAYRGRRSLNWLVGITLLLSTLLLSFTGYLLPWDQLALWAITVGTNIAKEAPIVGNWIYFLLLGGNMIGQETLIRFYVLHVFIIPVFVLIAVAYHMWRIRKDGGLAAMERLGDSLEIKEKAPSSAKTYSFFGLAKGTSVQVKGINGIGEENSLFATPHLLRRMMLVFLVTFTATLLLAIFFNAPLEEAANPSVTPNPAKAPWYFLWLQELVADTTLHLGKFTISGGLIGGILLPGVLLLVAALWPFLDRSSSQSIGVWFSPERRTQNWVFVAIIIAIILLMYLGVAMRGPNWKIYWPWQNWPNLPTLL